MRLITPSDSSHGEITQIAVSNPAAGANATITVPSGEIWRLLGVVAILTTSAVAITRYPFARIRDASRGTVAASPLDAALVASTGYGLNWTRGVCPAAAPPALTSFNICLFDSFAEAGQFVEVTAFNLQAGDAITGVGIHYERWRVTS